jgi:ferric-chelate reductase
MPLHLQHKARSVGGGDLRAGWILKKGVLPDDELKSPYSATSNPFDDPKDSHAPAPIPTLIPPPHISSLLSHLPFNPTLSAPFVRLGISLNLVELLFILSYLLIIAFALIWKSDITPTTHTKGYGSDFGRAGMVALVHVPVVVALGVRGNLIGLCVGKGYERLKVYHKIVGRVLFLAATLHAAFFSRSCSVGTRTWLIQTQAHKWAMAGKLSYFKKGYIIHGVVAWFAIILIASTSLPWVRNAWHGLFKVGTKHHAGRADESRSVTSSAWSAYSGVWQCT